MTREEFKAAFTPKVYEPEHITGGVCWCGVDYFKTEAGLEIFHKEQRNTLADLAYDLLKSS